MLKITFGDENIFIAKMLGAKLKNGAQNLFVLSRQKCKLLVTNIFVNLSLLGIYLVTKLSSSRKMSFSDDINSRKSLFSHTKTYFCYFNITFGSTLNITCFNFMC